ncbi:MAG: IclR family transcriptional regulator [Actinomycetia bacterium]|nr:IclR family transcriptional regulator [Actinomycetes bacterium]MCP4958559.1 IclR family transcriptional regulator [Actinomycetes bacterium]
MQAVDRTFAVLRALAAKPETSSLAEVAQLTGLPKNTTSRFLAALERLGMVERVGDRYAIGAGLATLTHAATPVSSLRELCRPYLSELSWQLGENASLAVADGNEVLYVDTVADTGVIQMQDWTGYHVPLHATAAGLALMSAWRRDDVVTLCDAGLSRLTPATVVDADALIEKLEDITRTGIAWTHAEFNSEVNAVAALVCDTSGGPVGAITVFGPTFRFPGDRPRSGIDDLILSAAAHIGARLEIPGDLPKTEHS